MSISDLIVVMKDGVIQQIGKPQEVYDEPVNLFVAKFLGTPPINVFRAAVKREKLMIGDECVLDVKGVGDGEVYAAIRPEGFLPDSNGSLTCDLIEVEVMGRDKTVVCSHGMSENVEIRAIVSSDHLVEPSGDRIRFSVKPTKVFLFNKETGERIRFQA